MIDLSRDGDVYVLAMDNGENRFSPAMLDALEAALATVEAHEGPNGLVTTGSGKFFSNGLDVDHMSADPDGLLEYLNRVDRLFASVLSLPCPTAAALNGHAFGAGAMLALAHDQRLMRTERGYWCLPEVDLGMPFPAGMRTLVMARLPRVTAHEAMVSGRRFDAEDALGASIVDAVRPVEELLAETVTRVQARAHQSGSNLAGIRTGIHADVMAALRRGEWSPASDEVEGR